MCRVRVWFNIVRVIKQCRDRLDRQCGCSVKSLYDHHMNFGLFWIITTTTTEFSCLKWLLFVLVCVSEGWGEREKARKEVRKWADTKKSLLRHEKKLSPPAYIHNRLAVSAGTDKESKTAQNNNNDELARSSPDVFVWCFFCHYVISIVLLAFSIIIVHCTAL